jgi:hypothetical protein
MSDNSNLSFTRAAAVTPSDTVDLAVVAKGFYVGAVGNVTVITAGGDTILFTAPALGGVHRIAVSRIKATGTTATGIVAVW